MEDYAKFYSIDDVVISYPGLALSISWTNGEMSHAAWVKKMMKGCCMRTSYFGRSRKFLWRLQKQKINNMLEQNKKNTKEKYFLKQENLQDDHLKLEQFARL